MNNISLTIAEFCTEIGSDPLMVQGAGGNVSWKDGKTLWVKASGNWLVDAVNKNIFVPVDLVGVKEAINNQLFSLKPRLIELSEMKPSIETFMHALMPSRIVVHLHSIEILSQLVKKSCREILFQVLNGRFEYLLVDYYKPGDSLAAAIYYAREDYLGVNIIFLKILQ